MATTMQDIVDRGRKPLNDAAKVRFADAADLLVFANDWIKIARRERPDLFFGSFANLPADVVIGANFPLPAEFEQSAADYVSGRAEALDNEAELEQRAANFLKLSLAGLGIGS
jgi:hypothetical protein